MKTSKLIRALVAGGLIGLASVSSFAAGLGRLTVHSSLGQPLNAEIELLSVQGGELETLAARISKPDAFEAAKIAYAPVLANVRFSVETKPGGQPYLRVTTSQPVNEPFLDMLVELTWASGRLVREIPLLLDPAGFEAGKAPAVAKTLPAKNGEAKRDPQPAKTKTSPADSPVVAGGEQTGGSQYAVKTGDTLTKIATQVKPAGVNLDQMLVALYRENKKAFINENMNLLKAKSVLVVPNAEQARTVSVTEAKKEVLSQSSNWNAYRGKLAGQVASGSAQSDTGSQSASGKIDKATVEPSTPAAAAPKDVLKLSKGDGKGAPAGKSAADDKASALREDAIARANQMREDKARIAELEKNIVEMERLLALKSQSMAELQKQAEAAKSAAAKQAQAPVEKKMPEVKPEAAPKPTVSTKPALETKPAPEAKPTAAVKPAPEAKPAPEVKAAPVPDPKPAPEAKPAPAPQPVQATPSEKPVQAEKSTPAPENKSASEQPPKPAPKKAASPPPPEPSFAEELMENPLYIFGGIGVGAVLFGLLGYGAYRRRQQQSSNDSPATIGATSSLATDLRSGTAPNAKSSGVVDTGNSSFLTDFEKTGPGIIDVEEVDPVAEAEVYIAYGRDAQAEEILKEAMAKDAGRHEIPLKLLEIYSARKSAASFESIAKELHRSVGGSHPVWSRVAEMGRKLDPSNSLYTAAAVTAGAAVAASAPNESEMPTLHIPRAQEPAVSLPPEIPVAPPPPPVQEMVTLPPLQESAPAPQDLDFDLDLPPPRAAASSSAPMSSGLASLDLSLPTDSAPVEEKAPAPSVSLDFDLGGLELPKPMLNRAEPPAADQTMLARPKFAAQFSDDVLDLTDFSMGANSESAAAAPVEQAPASKPETHLPDLALDIGEPIISAAIDTAARRPAPAPSLDLGGLNLDLSSASLAQELPTDTNVDSEWHSVATKLDLAKAYLEIGDRDGAKEILQEVLQEGDTDQKREAEELTASLV